MANSLAIRFKTEGQTNNTVIEDVLRGRPGWMPVGSDDTNWDIFWCDLATTKLILESSMKNHQKIAHYRNFYEISRKNYLARNLKRYRRQCVKNGNTEEAELSNAMPMTFEIPSETALFLQEARRDSHNMWIVKPSGGSQGRGILLFKKLSEFEEWRENKDWSPKERKRSDDPNDIELIPEVYVAQKYITNPYLLEGRKFDMRMYVLVTSFSPLTVWIARDGFARIAGIKYCKDNFADNCMHLTNTAIQLSGENLSQGRKWDIQNLRLFLTAMHGREIVDELFQKIAKVVITALKSVECIMMGNKHCFELFGFDILLQDNLNVCLLEANAAPSMKATDDHDYKLKYNLIQDALNVIDLEKKLTGKEIRVGGFDKIWCGGPIYQINKGMNAPEFCKKSHFYNMYLGCVNDRDEQLEEMTKWMNILKKETVV
ncbi:hypothetical protein M8J76_006834 [Diaphorina citri]|nr:hypothetical protein M8J76_006834 [Diaphorina citri]